MLKPSSQQMIEELLESDDELPTDYNEVPEIPAYQNDRRFEPIKFKWIDSNFSKYYCKKKTEQNLVLPALNSLLNENDVHKRTQNLAVGQKTIIMNGVLNQQDIYCLKSLEPITSDATLLWLINFMMFKDLQSNFNFLKTCLVDTLTKEDNNGEDNLSESKKYNFDIIVRSGTFKK